MTVLVYVDHEDATTICRPCRQRVLREQTIAENRANLAEAIREQRDNWRHQCGVTGELRKRTFEGFDVARQPKPADRQLLQRAFDALSNWHGQSLVLVSPVLPGSDGYGLGKSHLLAALVNRLVNTREAVTLREDGSDMTFHRCPALYVMENPLLGRIRETFNRQTPALGESDNRETDEYIYRLLSRVELLVLDDVGKIVPKDPTFLQSVLFRVIDERYNAGLPLIMATNLLMRDADTSPGHICWDLETHLGGATADRLREMCGRDGFLLLKGKSQRRV